MADKPRVKAPKKRVPAKSEGADRRKVLVVIGVATFALVAIAGGLSLLGSGGGASLRVDDVTAVLRAGGCRLQVAEALPGAHSITDPNSRSNEWNTDPPTSGPHYGFNPDGSLGTVIWGAYEEPIQLARTVHNLEHGGVYIFYGDDVPQSVVDQLRSFYNKHESGTLLAPLPRLGDKIALGAWVVDGASNSGYLAKCKAFDDDAFSTFFAAFQFKGPERFPASELLPGGN